MPHPSRRHLLVVAGGVALSGCVGPAGQQDTPPPEHDDDSDDDTPARGDPDRIQEAVADVATFLDEAAESFEGWEAEVEEIGVGTMDGLRADTRSLLTRYENDVLPYEEDIRNAELAGDWSVDGDALANLLPIHESLLYTIEDASIGIVDAEGDPDRVGARHHEMVEEVIEDGPAIAAETRSALGN